MQSSVYEKHARLLIPQISIKSELRRGIIWTRRGYGFSVKTIGSGLSGLLMAKWW
jgi:hypothetical protein